MGLHSLKGYQGRGVLLGEEPLPVEVKGAHLLYREMTSLRHYNYLPFYARTLIRRFPFVGTNRRADYLQLVRLVDHAQAAIHRSRNPAGDPLPGGKFYEFAVSSQTMHLPILIFSVLFTAFLFSQRKQADQK